MKLFQGYHPAEGAIPRSDLSFLAGRTTFTWHVPSLQCSLSGSWTLLVYSPSPSYALHSPSWEGEGRRGSRRMNQRGTVELSVLHWSSSRKDEPRIICDYLSAGVLSRRQRWVRSPSLSPIRFHATPAAVARTFCSLALSSSTLSRFRLIVPPQ